MQTHHYQSKTVNSNQEGIHHRLVDVVNRHIHSQYQKPYRTHNVTVFDIILSSIQSHGGSPLILDSCCGTGMSTRRLAKEHPDALVIGIDQSQKRLDKNTHEQIPENCRFFQANCEDIWRLCIDHSIIFDQHYILYPNPWPKAEHLKRRWHGHPVFPVLKPLSKTTMLRSNWLTYLHEFAEAWRLLCGQTSLVATIDVVDALTLFEHKYASSGQALYELQVYARHK